MKLSLEKKIVGLVALLIGAVLIILFVIIRPTVQKIKNINAETNALRADLERKYAQSLAVRLTLKKMSTFKKSAALYNEHLFHSSDELKLITELERLAAARHLEQKIDQSNLNKTTNQRMRLRYSVVGGYGETLAYLSDLERSSFFISIEELHWSPFFSNPITQSPSTTLQLVISVYVNK